MTSPHHINRKDIGARIKRIRKARDLMQKDLADRIGRHALVAVAQRDDEEGRRARLLLDGIATRARASR